MKSKSVSRGALIIGVSVLLSRVLGIFRDILLANYSGINAEKTAYDLAFLLPDIINHLVSTGYLSITFIPIFTGYLIKKDPEGAWKFFSSLMTFFLVVLIPIIIIAWIWTKPLILVLTRTDPDPQTLEMAVEYCRIVLPAQIFFLIGLLLVAVQHVNLQFMIPALGGLVYNGSIIAGGWLFREQGLKGFAWGVLAGSISGFLVLQILGGRRVGVRYSLVVNFFSRDIKHYLSLTLPLVLGLGAVFALEVIFRVYGSSFGPGGIAKLGYAYRMMFALVAVFGYSLGAASYPLLARFAKEQRYDQINDMLFSSTGRMISALTPVFLIGWFGAEAVIKVILERGLFSPDDTTSVAGLLRWYLWSVFGLSIQTFLVRCFYALERMWLPTLVNSGIFLATIPLYEIFSRKFGISGIPIAGGIGVSMQVLILLIIWIKIAGSRGCYQFGANFLKTMFIFILMFLVMRNFQPVFSTWRNYQIPAALYILAAFSASVLLVNIFLQILFRVSYARELVNLALKKAGIRKPE